MCRKSPLFDSHKQPTPRIVSSNLSSQFCLSLYLAPLSKHRMLLKSYEEDIKQVSSASTKHNIFVYYYYYYYYYFLFFLTELSFQVSINVLPSLAISAIHYNRQQIVSMPKLIKSVLNNNTGPCIIFGI